MHGSENTPREILLVGDDADLVETYRLWIDECEDIQPTVVHHGTWSVQRTINGTDILILDRSIRDQSGPKLLDHLKPAEPSVMVISVEDLNGLSTDEVDISLAKPVDRDEFLSALDTVL